MADALTVYGIDFTSRPSTRKPITCLECRLVGSSISPVRMHKWPKSNFEEFEGFLATSSDGQPWIAAIDFPFGLPLRFVENKRWPTIWSEYMDHMILPLSCRKAWRQLLEDYRRPRCYGDKEHRRRTDEIAGSVSPQKVYGVPVGLMFYEGAKRLRGSSVLIPGLQDGSPERVVVEGYPGVAARQLVGRLSYKGETKKHQLEATRLTARQSILRALAKGGAKAVYGLEVPSYSDLAQFGGGGFVKDATGDCLDALLCSVQAAWASRQGGPDFGMRLSPTEGCIADPVWKCERFKVQPFRR